VLVANGHVGLEVSHNNEPNKDSEEVLDVTASTLTVAAAMGASRFEACAPPCQLLSSPTPQLVRILCSPFPGTWRPCVQQLALSLSLSRTSRAHLASLARAPKASVFQEYSSWILPSRLCGALALAADANGSRRGVAASSLHCET
jgi:hypothetical protein